MKKVKGVNDSVLHASLSCLLIDFGGVFAEEGFREGLIAIAGIFDKEPEWFFNLAADIVYDCGYVTGRASEHDFWETVRERSGINADDQFLTNQILSRFIPRPGMIKIVESLKKHDITVCLLSDQTDWLDRLDQAYHFSQFFDHIFNSYYLGKTKRDMSIFSDVLAIIHHSPSSALFVDDNKGHIDRARKSRLQTHLFIDEESFRSFLRNKKLL